MSQVNVCEVKAKFAEYLDRVVRGERIVIYRYNKPVAELRPVEATRTDPRPVGPIAGRPTFDIPPSFFEPLDEDDVKAWEGMSGAPDPLASAYAPHVPDTTARVADAAPQAERKSRRTRARRT